MRDKSGIGAGASDARMRTIIGDVSDVVDDDDIVDGVNMNEERRYERRTWII